MMDEATGAQAQQGEQAPRPDGRKPYQKPRLTVFGHVAALTQGSGCSASNDGIDCPAAGGSGMGMTVSDRRLKQDIVRIGEHPAGFGLYLFSYVPSRRGACGHGRRFGVMADEVEAVMPEAVITREDGYKAVRYELLGVHPALH